MTVLCVVQARMGSSRLPGKVLQELTPGETLLSRVLMRLGRAQELDVIVVATTREPEDDAIAAACHDLGVACVRGDTFDVLGRFVDAMRATPDADVVVRVTADCPFVDPGIVDELVRALRREGADFVANRLPPPHQRTYPVGLDVEVCTRVALDEAARRATVPHHREHVMPFLYENSAQFTISVLELSQDLSHHRWTVDTPQDLEVVRGLAAAVGAEPFDWTQLLAVVEANPELERANREVLQKDVTVVDERR